MFTEAELCRYWCRVEGGLSSSTLLLLPFRLHLILFRLHVKDMIQRGNATTTIRERGQNQERGQVSAAASFSQSSLR